jgi:hypothetical protein
MKHAHVEQCRRQIRVQIDGPLKVIERGGLITLQKPDYSGEVIQPVGAP